MHRGVVALPNLVSDAATTYGGEEYKVRAHVNMPSFLMEGTCIAARIDKRPLCKEATTIRLDTMQEACNVV